MPAAQKKLLIHPGFLAGNNQSLQTYSPAMGVAVDVKRGFMLWDQPGGNLGYTGGSLGNRDKIDFQFNPSTINSSYTVANGSMQASMLFPTPGSTSTYLAPLQGQNVSFDLYYDRTMELNYGSGQGSGKGQPNDPAVLGCQADVLQFMQFTGMLANLSTLGANGVGGYNAILGGTTGASLPATSIGSGGIMIMQPAWIYFSNSLNQAFTNGSFNWSALNKELAYYGYIESWSVNYTHWTQAMVPIRCVISVSFTMLPDPAKSGTAQALNNSGQFVTGPGTAPQRAPGTAGNFPVGTVNQQQANQIAQQLQGSNPGIGGR